MCRWLRAALLALLLAPCAHAADWYYTVRPGDELWNVAARYCGSAAFAQRIAEENGLADAASIQPGSRLRIPVDWLVRQPATARLTAVRGAALLMVPSPHPAEVGASIEMGQRLRTEQGAAVVTFADGSTLQVSEQTDVLFNVLTAYGDTGMVDTNLRFYRGRSTSRIRPGNGASRFRISTPSGTAAVRGTEFRLGVESDRTLTETVEGEVGFRQDQEVLLPAGFGVVAGPGSVERESLLEAPVWLSAPGTHALGAELNWQPVSGAERYRVSAFAAANPLNPLLEQIVDEPRFRLDGLTSGPHRFTVRAISPRGLEGFDADLEIAVMGAAPRPEATGDMERGATRLVWQDTLPPYRVQIAEDADFAAPHTYTADAAHLNLPDLAAGQYYWRVRDDGSVFSEARTLTVRPPPVTRVQAAAYYRRGTVRWASVPDADGYQVRLLAGASDAEPLQVHTVSTPTTELSLPRYGTYRIEVRAIQNEVAGDPGQTTLEARRRMPWWTAPAMILALFAF